MMDLKVFAKTIEPSALAQIDALANHPAFANSKVRIMPDVHSGAGCVIGFTATLSDKKVVPNLIGVDIGCGVMAVKLNNVFELTDEDLWKLDMYIHNYVPAGFEIHSMPLTNNPPYFIHYNFPMLDEVRAIIDRDYALRALGSLGGGNHYIEVDVDEEGSYWLIVHTGSRNLGKKVCEYYQKKAVDYCLSADINKLDPILKAKIITALKEANQPQLILQTLKALTKPPYGNLPKDLCFIEGENYTNYMYALKWCQDWAYANRIAIINNICRGMKWTYKENNIVHSVHNYINTDDNIIRKGAISAQANQHLIIPLNMQAGHIIGYGCGNPDWNFSAPHGAGRVMSRSAARENIKIEDYKQSMTNVFTTCVNDKTIDEAPAAYKDPEEIIKQINGTTVSITQRLKPVYNFKASDA